MPLWNEEVGDDDVIAARAPHPQGMPCVQDVRLVGWEEHKTLHRVALIVTAWLVPVHDLGEEQGPVAIMAAADKRPLPTQLVATLHRDRPPPGCERSHNDGLRRMLHDLRPALVR